MCDYVSALPLWCCFLLQYSVFFCHHDGTDSTVFSFYFLTAVVSQFWQIAVPTARSRCVLYQFLGSEKCFYPEVFSQRCFTTAAEASMSKHRLPSALWKNDCIIHSQPPRQCQLQVSLCLVAAEQHPVSLHLFGLLWHSLGSHGWLAWCVIVGLVILLRPH